jgi:hypothetical protein
MRFIDHTVFLHLRYANVLLFFILLAYRCSFYYFHAQKFLLFSLKAKSAHFFKLKKGKFRLQTFLF